MSIEYHKITNKDYKRIKQLITEAWFSGDYLEEIKNDVKQSEPKISIYSIGYLYMHMSNSSFRIGAYENDKLVGFLFGRCEKERIKHRFINKCKLFLTGIRMLFTKVGRRGLRIYKEEHKLDSKMHQMYDKEDNELVLFIVDKNYRSLGIGRNLENKFIEHLKTLNKTCFYLYTDTYSNYQYYEKHSYYRYQTMPTNYGGENAEYYIYVKEI